MNLLAHLLLAERSETSFAGQILGDEIKGRLDDRFQPPVRHGIRLHRAIDGHSDAHDGHRRLRNLFEAPHRRYAGILVDIGLDHALARHWADFHTDSLASFARHAQRRVMAEWPSNAPFSRLRLRGLGNVLEGYRNPQGIQRALNSVAARLRRDNPVADALPAIQARQQAFAEELDLLIDDLTKLVARIDQSARDPEQ
ncbi:ACP phosphodiesterase [Salinisphaera sp.]|uniref:acyl carrier protein phosphodiesterase n=1 Tax=Salinisphaera sp. TaxID=1914330 RepID=UPI000C520708|nr:ACP phosphodiesterase [Salinisphaera sp.]MBS62723.1 hypothetical protein [Salinisphaera sp.]